MISIICASNDKKVLNNYLIPSLKKQTYKDDELIIVDTVKNKYKGCVDALNDGIKQSKGDTLLFVHHDVVFEDKNELKNINKYIKDLDYGIVGVAGVTNKRNTLIGNITNGPDKERISNITINAAVEAETLDEVLFIIKKENINKHPFNIKNDTWHLYAVEYSLSMKDINKKVYVIPSKIYHASPGYSLNKSYFDYLPNIIKKYKKKYRSINTTVGSWFTNSILFKLQMIRRKQK